MIRCKGCGRKMAWGFYTDQAGKVVKVPLDLEAPVYYIASGLLPVEGLNEVFRSREAVYVSHFKTCPKAGQFSGGKR